MAFLPQQRKIGDDKNCSPRHLICSHCRTYISYDYDESETILRTNMEIFITEAVINTRKNCILGSMTSGRCENLYVGGIECITCGNPVGLRLLRISNYESTLVQDFEPGHLLSNYSFALQAIQNKNSERLNWWRVKNELYLGNYQLRINNNSKQEFNYSNSHNYIHGPYLLNLQTLDLVDYK